MLLEERMDMFAYTSSTRATLISRTRLRDKLGRRNKTCKGCCVALDLVAFAGVADLLKRLVELLQDRKAVRSV